MSEETPLLELYKLSAQLRPLISRCGGRLLKVIFEFDGRQVTYNHDDKEFPSLLESDRQMMVPPPPPSSPVSAPSALPQPPKPASPPGRVQMVEVNGFQLPIPPMAGTEVSFNTNLPKKRATRADPVEGIEPLTDKDICPIGKKHPNTKMEDIPADYLDWLYGQPWLRSKHPRLWAYIVRHEDVITKELKSKGKA